ncbi:MAG: chromosomal replication initiator protein DnaA [Bacilli bacterium]|nr:chromosomal replication initiator protein DnaA [Bacilli bacterium]MDD4406605.1 chromosomal replication initiator protein DnaA [Bacilli bacterium]
MDNNLLWSNFLQIIKTKISPVSYDTWFKDTKIIRQDNNILSIQVPMVFHKKFLNETYYDLIDEIITNLIGNSFDLEFMTEEEFNYEDNDIIKETIDNEYTRINSNLNSKYTFENFVIGDSNRFAQTAAVAVAEQPGKIYNPLFIHGKSGLGKTHLMHAIGNYVLQNSKKKILYVTSEEFISDFIGINKKDENNLPVIEHFKEKYRNIDVLIIDDIQFLGGAEKTQQEFFHTFNNLYDSNKQIIISSDRSPDDLKLLEDRLRTRFRWGLTVDIYPPDFELRCKILKDKMAGHEVANLVNKEVIEYIATNCENDVRHLEGAITRLYAYAAIMSPNEINLSFATEALKDYIGTSIYITNNITKIQKAVADYYKITVDDLKTKKRTSNINLPRQIAIYLCRMTTEETIVKIGLEFGNRNHSTVLHAYDKINNELKINNKLKEEINEIKNKIVN